MKRCSLLLIVILLISSFSACMPARPMFNGNMTSNDSEFLIDYTVLNSTYDAALKLEEGDILNVEIVSDSGKVDIEVKKENGGTIYTGTDLPTGPFQLPITETGSYLCTVTGKEAAGSVSFIKESGE